VFVEPSQINVSIPLSQRYGKRTFPDRIDYVHALGHDLDASASPESIAGVARHWHATGQTGCLFARLLARTATSTEWPSAVIPEATDDALRGISTCLASSVARPEVQLVSLLFPQISTVADVKGLVGALAANTSLMFFEDRAVPQWVRVAGRYDVGNGVLAWLMAFGPFPSWPPTRRGPVFELVVRTKPKREGIFEKLNQDPTVAHLADIDLGFDTAKTSNLFDGTERATRDVLGEEPDGLSAAKTTFSFEAELWDAAPGPGLQRGSLADEPDYPPAV